MTWKAVREVIDLEGVKPTAKLVLLALAIRANTEGRAWPSVKRICMDTGLSDRGVRVALQALAKDGYITLDSRPGHTSMLTVGAPVDNPDPGTSCRPDPGTSAHDPGTSCRTPRHEVPTEVVKERDKKEVRAAGTSPSVPAAPQNGHVNYGGPAPVAAQEAARERRRQAAADCPFCDELGITDGDGWCKHPTTAPTPPPTPAPPAAAQRYWYGYVNGHVKDGPKAGESWGEYRERGGQ